MLRQQGTGLELEVVEVDHPAAAFERLVTPAEPLEQAVQERHRRHAEPVGAGLLIDPARGLVAFARGADQRARPVAQGELRDAQRRRCDRPARQLCGGRELIERPIDRPGGRRGSELGGELASGARQRRRGGRLVVAHRRNAERRRSLTAAAQLVIDRVDRDAQLEHAELRGEVEGSVIVEPLAERVIERRIAKLRRLGVAEHREVGRQPDEHRVRAQQPRAEAVEGRHERPQAGARRLALAGGAQPQPDPFAQLARRAIGEGDREDPAGRDAIFDDGRARSARRARSSCRCRRSPRVRAGRCAARSPAAARR